MKKKYEILEHKADLKIKVFGKTKEELFLNALLSMQDCMKPEFKKPEEKAERFGEDIKAVTYHQLDIHQGKDEIWEATVLFDI